MNAAELLTRMKNGTDKFFGFNISLRCRKREFVYARQMFTTYLRKYHPFYTLTTIGMITGGRDHSTVLHDEKAFSDLHDTDSHFRNQWVKYLIYMADYTKMSRPKSEDAVLKALQMQWCNGVSYNELYSFYRVLADERGMSFTNTIYDVLQEYKDMITLFGVVKKEEKEKEEI